MSRKRAVIDMVVEDEEGEEGEVVDLTRLETPARTPAEIRARTFKASLPPVRGPLPSPVRIRPAVGVRARLRKPAVDKPGLDVPREPEPALRLSQIETQSLSFGSSSQGRWHGGSGGGEDEDKKKSGGDLSAFPMAQALLSQPSVALPSTLDSASLGFPSLSFPAMEDILPVQQAEAAPASAVVDKDKPSVLLDTHMSFAYSPLSQVTQAPDPSLSPTLGEDQEEERMDESTDNVRVLESRSAAGRESMGTEIMFTSVRRSPGL